MVEDKEDLRPGYQSLNQLIEDYDLPLGSLGWLNWVLSHFLNAGSGRVPQSHPIEQRVPYGMAIS